MTALFCALLFPAPPAAMPAGLSEVDPRFGGFLNNNIAEYQIAVNADVRQLEVELLDTPDLGFSEIGAKGVGECARPFIFVAQPLIVTTR